MYRFFPTDVEILKTVRMYAGGIMLMYGTEEVSKQRCVNDNIYKVKHPYDLGS